jgi:proteasome activator subunit 4
LITLAAPSNEEIAFIMQILDDLVAPILDKVEQLLETVGVWDNVARNDFCRQAGLYAHSYFRAKQIL